MEYRFRSPRNPLEWIVTVLALGVVIALGILAAGVAVVAIGVAILVAPVVAWWRARKGPDVETTESGDRVVDVEFKVEDERR